MLCVIAKIDADSRQKLNAIRRSAEQYGAAPRNLHGHITLASYLDADENILIPECKAILSDKRAFCVRYDKIEIFSASSIIAATPCKNEMLCSVHNSLVSIRPDLLDKWTRNSVWQPHTTLVYMPDCDLRPVAQAMQALFSPFTARIEKIEFSKEVDNGYEIVDAVQLK